MLLLTGLVLAGTRMNVATDVSPWFLDGYSVLLMVDAEPWRVSAELWGMDFPQRFVEMNPANAGEGWHRRVDLGMALYVDRHFFDDNAGWHAGLLFNGFHNTVQLQTEQASFWSVEVLARGGYRWFPFEEGRLFVNPWVGAGPLLALDEPSVSGERYDELPYQIIGTAHLGWRFR